MVKRILIVDDEKSVAFFTRENLIELGTEYHVEAALSGPEALNKMSTCPFDLVISDFRMPKMNGLEVCKWLKDNLITQNIPVIMLTSQSDLDTLSQGLDLGAIDFIPKDMLSQAVLLETLTNLGFFSGMQSWC